MQFIKFVPALNVASSDFELVPSHFLRVIKNIAETSPKPITNIAPMIVATDSIVLGVGGFVGVVVGEWFGDWVGDGIGVGVGLKDGVGDGLAVGVGVGVGVGVAVILSNSVTIQPNDFR